MRLIDANRLQKYLYDSGLWNDSKAAFYSMIENSPTIDAVPVVQCKDCRYKYMAKVNDKGFLICPASGMEITDDDFCSYGERRTDEI